MTFYITTPIYYVNDVPHLGHAYTTIVADALARFHRMRGHDTRFLTGTDEHGQKVEAAAQKRGLTPQQLVDEVGPRFDETWRSLGITGYRFIRTTDAKHNRVVSGLVLRRLRSVLHREPARQRRRQVAVLDPQVAGQLARQRAQLVLPAVEVRPGAARLHQSASRADPARGVPQRDRVVLERR